MAKLIIEIDEKSINKAHALLDGDLSTDELKTLSNSEISMDIAELKALDPNAALGIACLSIGKYAKRLVNNGTCKSYKTYT